MGFYKINNFMFLFIFIVVLDVELFGEWFVFIVLLFFISDIMGE